MQWALLVLAAAARPLTRSDAADGAQGLSAEQLHSWQAALPAAAQPAASFVRELPIVRADLLKWRWTMFVGDSILLGQFLSLAQELRARPAEAALSNFEPCTNPATKGTWATGEAIHNFAGLPHEYLVTCTGEACEFRRIGCLNLYPQTCVVDCHDTCATTAEWTQMLAKIQTVIAQPGGFALSFHWAPARLEHPKVLERLPAFVPGRMLWNNCHHWFGAVPGAPDAAKRDLWLQYVFQDAVLLKQLLPSGVFFQGCAQLRCAATDPECAASNAWLAGMTQSAAGVLAGLGIPVVDPLPLLTTAVVAAAFVDGRHPCYPVPCMWSDEAATAPRECCASLLRQAFHAMDAPGYAMFGAIGSLQPWGNGSHAVPTLF